MKKPNYSLDKRKREMKKQKKNEEKRLRKLNKSSEQPADAVTLAEPAAPGDTAAAQ